MATLKEVEEGKIYAFLGIFLTVIGFVIVLLTKKDNEYAMFYAKQGLVLFIAYVVVAIINWLPLPFLNWFIWVLWILLFILWIMGIVYAFSGEEKDIPVIGPLAKNFKI